MHQFCAKILLIQIVSFRQHKSMHYMVRKHVWHNYEAAICDMRLEFGYVEKARS